MTDIVGLSQSICSESSSYSEQAPPKQTRFNKGTSPKDAKSSKEKEVPLDLDRITKIRLHRIINDYLNSQYLGPKLGHITAPHESASLDVLNQTIASIKTTIAGETKRLLVNSMFTKGVQGAEEFFVQFLKVESLEGVSGVIADDMENFQPELEEIAIEMGDDWIPSAKMRLFWKVIDFGMEYSKARKGYNGYNSNPPDNSTHGGRDEEDELPEVVGNFDSPEAGRVLDNGVRFKKGKSPQN